MSTENVFQLVYLSFISPSVVDSEVEAILDVARKKNEDLNITGMLLCRHGVFLQILEGPREAIEELYFKKIIADPRHQNCKVVLSREVKERLFPFWTMGFKDVSEINFRFLDKVDEIERSFKQGQQDQELEEDLDIIELFKIFRYTPKEEAS